MQAEKLIYVTMSAKLIVFKYFYCKAYAQNNNVKTTALFFLFMNFACFAIEN